MRSTSVPSRTSIKPESEEDLEQTGLASAAHPQREPSIVHPLMEDLEEYYFGRVTPHQEQVIDDHLMVCDACLERLDALLCFVLWLALQDYTKSPREQHEKPTPRKPVANSQRKNYLDAKIISM